MVDTARTTLGTMPPFFVRKKDGRIRVIFDAREVNQHFAVPDKPALGSPSAFGDIIIPRDSQLYFALSDIKDYFYSIGVPPFLRQWFGLPKISRAEAVQLGLDASCADRHGNVCPRLTVLPMGWC